MQLTVPDEAAGTRLDRFLAEPLGSRAQAQTLIDAGHVLVDGRARPKRHAVSAGRAGDGQREPAAREPASRRRRRRRSRSPTRTSTCWSSTSRPASSCTRRAGTGPGRWPRRWPAAAAGGEEPWRAGIVHRLDRDTSGLLVVAKSDDVHRALKATAGRARAAPRVPGARRRASRGADRARSTPRSAAIAATAC